MSNNIFFELYSQHSGTDTYPMSNYKHLREFVKTHVLHDRLHCYENVVDDVTEDLFYRLEDIHTNTELNEEDRKFELENVLTYFTFVPPDFGFTGWDNLGQIEYDWSKHYYLDCIQAYDKDRCSEQEEKTDELQNPDNHDQIEEEEEEEVEDYEEEEAAEDDENENSEEEEESKNNSSK